jgi:hypothetical protein
MGNVHLARLKKRHYKDIVIDHLAASCRISAYKQPLPSVIARNPST